MDTQTLSQTTKPVNDWLGSREIQGGLGISEQTFYRWAEKGLIPGLRRIGNRWKIRRGDLDLFIEGARS